MPVVAGDNISGACGRAADGIVVAVKAEDARANRIRGECRRAGCICADKVSDDKISVRRFDVQIETAVARNNVTRSWSQSADGIPV